MQAASLRLHLVTLGVDDIERAARFYEKLGMKRRVRNAEGVAFFEAGGVALAVFGRAELAKDAKLENTKPGFGGFALAFNVKDEAEVETVLAAAEKAGGRIQKPAQRAFWGGFHGYFTDPDGHPWEVAFNPHFPFDDRGGLLLPD